MNTAQIITLVIIFTIIPIIIYLKKRNMKEGIVLEKIYKKSSRFMAFQYKVEIEKDGKKIEVETPVLMTEYEVGDKIKF